MVDIDLVVQALRNQGYEVGDVIPVPENAGEYEIYVDGELLSLSEVDALLEDDQTDDAADLPGTGE